VALLVGVLIAFTLGLMATAVGFDRDRAFYPTVTIVIASYYAFFAVMGASTQALLFESLAAHGVFDLAHDSVMSNPGVPLWWPAFCLAYDLTAATYLAWVLKTGRIRGAT
jgi:hypothetical protein